MRLFRAHGLGNDYLVVESGPGGLSPARVRALCDRHRGVGSDGVLEPLFDAGFGLRIHNPDGSEAEKSGNGLRIFAWWLHHRRGAPPGFTVWTAGGVVACEVDGDEVSVDMGPAKVGAVERLAGVPVRRVDLGNPHAVVMGWRDDWRTLGQQIECAVPGRTNVQFVEVREGTAHARIWERGAGETMSSGSSACAVAAVCVAEGRCTSPVAVRMAGGALVIEVGETLRMRGPVEAVATVDVDAGWLRSHS